MPVIAVINRKGGSGKSTLATHIASSLAREGKSVMLGDVDKQQSSRSWLRRRTRVDPALPPIRGWVVDHTAVARPPAGVSHLVLDTPGGLTGFQLARLVMWCDAILIPLCDSAFDRESAAACFAELSALPRIASGRCRVGVVGMRIDRRTRGHESLQAWAAEHGMTFLGSLRNTQLYVQCAERGLTMFDLPAGKAASDLDEWAPVLAWLRDVTPAKPSAAPAPAHAARPAPEPPLRSFSATLSPPSSQEADMSELTLTGVARPGLWGLLRRLWA